MFDRTRISLREAGLPESDLWDLPTSDSTFSDGGHFRIEVPTVNSIETAVALLKESQRLNITINRITETFGIFRHSQQEIKDWVNLCNDYGCELVMSPGPRATYDTSATAATPHGGLIGYRLRGQEQLVRAIEDLFRGLELGVTHFLVYDEGMLWLLGRMRQQGEIPSEVTFKVSAHCGHSNGASIRLLSEIGADSINPVRDLQLPMIAALRASTTKPLDLHIDNAKSSGGFIRVYEAPEIVRIAAPVYLKTGNSVLSSHGLVTTADNGTQMARQASIVVEMVNRYYPEALQSQVPMY